MQVLFTLLAFLLTTGILVLFHELGHFWMARLFHVRILRFSIGFGPFLWSRRLGSDQTEYGIAAIPLGGYVKMLGETPEDLLEPADRFRSFTGLHPAQKFLVAAAGPLANLVLAVVAYAVTAMAGIPGIAPVVGQVEPRGVAAGAGLQPGDRILAVDGSTVSDWQDLRMRLLAAAVGGTVVILEVRTPGGTRQRLQMGFGHLPPDSISSGFISRVVGLGPYLPPVIGSVVPHSPAARLGLRPGDRILAVNGQLVPSWQFFARAVEANPMKEIRVRWQDMRGQVQHGSVQPGLYLFHGQPIGRMGVTLAPLPASLIVLHRRPPIQALGYGFGETVRISRLTLEMLWQMVQGVASTSNISGPISIAQMAGESLELGVGPYFSFLALISVSLAILNLLPVPILDGGHLVFHGIEWITGRPVSPAVVQKAQMIGIVLLVVLLLFAFYNDLSRLLKP